MVTIVLAMLLALQKLCRFHKISTRFGVCAPRMINLYVTLMSLFSEKYHSMCVKSLDT